jgi:hypothetical protein
MRHLEGLLAIGLVVVCSGSDGGRGRKMLLEKEVSLEEPWSPDLCLVATKSAGASAHSGRATYERNWAVGTSKTSAY